MFVKLKSSTTFKQTKVFIVKSTKSNGGELLNPGCRIVIVVAPTEDAT